MGETGLKVLAQVRDKYNLPVVTEVMAISQIEVIAAHADMLQVGSRNMQNFDLLKELGRELIAPLSRAAIACGADGLIIECHPVPEKSVSDAQQALSLEEMIDLVYTLVPFAFSVGRKISTNTVGVGYKSTPFQLAASNMK